MARETLFPRGGRRPIMQTQAQALSVRDVRSEDELRAAISSAIPQGATGFAGVTLRLAAPISVSSPIVIPATLPGFTIDGQGQLLSPLAPLSSVFRVEAQFFTLLRVVISVEDVANAPDVVVEVPDGVVAPGAGFGVLRGCLFFGAGAVLRLPASPGAPSWLASECRYEQNGATLSGPTFDLGGQDNCGVILCTAGYSSAPSEDGVRVNAATCRVQDNQLGSRVFFDAAASEGIIAGNFVAEIDTVSSGGGNVIDGNNGVGTLSAHGGDVVGDNG